MRAVILFALMGAGLGAQPASIEGIVVDQTTGKPLERVHVLLMTGGEPRDVAETYGALSDSAGRFSVGKIQPGRYRLAVERTSYVQMADKGSLSLNAGQPVADVTLKAGQQLTGLKVAMARAAMIAGHVMDEYGDPVSHIPVELVPIPPVRAARVGQTDDRGEFRILSGPGKYYLLAMPRLAGKSGPPEVRSDGTSEAIYAITYYPDTASKDRASVVEVGAGRDIDGLDIHLAASAPQRPLSVSGTVTGMPPGASGFLLLIPAAEAGEQMMEPSMAQVEPNGRFSISGLRPGTYNVTVSTNTAKKPRMGRTRIKLETSDVSNVLVVVSEAGEVAGTLETIGSPAASAPAGKPSVHLEPVGPDFTFGGESTPGEVDAGGAFRIANVWPGRFRLRVDPLPETAYVKTVEVDGSVVPDGVVEVAGGNIPRVKITVGLDGAAISGRVLDEDGEPDESGRVTVCLLGNATEIKGAHGTGLEQGKYSLQGIRPGKYRLFLFNAEQLPDDYDQAHLEELMQKLFAAGEEIEVRPGDRISKDLKVPRKEATDAGKK